MTSPSRGFRFAAALLAASALLLGSAAEAGKKKKSKPANWDASVTFVNKTSWDIHHVFLSPSDVDSWGPDQLGEDVLEVGGTFTLTGIECDWYDIKLVDEDGDECVVEEIDLCVEDERWVITNKDLLACEWGS